MTSNPLISLSRAAQLTPGNPTRKTVWRWCRVGIKARDGGLVTLKYQQIGGRVFTTEADLRDFLAMVHSVNHEHFANK